MDETDLETLKFFSERITGSLGSCVYCIKDIGDLKALVTSRILLVSWVQQ